MNYVNFSFLNFLILIVIVIIIIIFLVIINDYYCTIRGYVDSIIDKTKSLIPSMNLDDGVIIEYPEEELVDYLDNDDFSKNKAIFLASMIRSSYNLTGNKDPYLPKYIEFVRSIGNNGYLFKINLNNNNKYGNNSKMCNRNLYVLTYRGTTSFDDLLTDIDSIQKSYKNLNNEENIDIKIHRGFYNYWDESRDDLLQIINTITKHDKLIITGHSLGCTSAALSAISISSYLNNFYGKKNYDINNISLYMFAPPRVGNDVFIEELDYLVPNNWAIINSSDIVPELPPVTLPTIGNNWIYDNWSNRIIIDIQYGSVLFNHRVGSYICGFIDDIDDRIDNPICSSYEHHLKWHRKYYRLIKIIE